MRRFFIGILGMFLFHNAIAQQNYYNPSGNVGLGTNNPTAQLNLNWQYAQIKLQGADASFLNSDLIISRLTSGNIMQRSPNIQFLDDATGARAFIQSYQGTLQFFPNSVQTLTLLPNKVGISNSSPLATFQVETSVNKFTAASASALGGTSYIGFNAYRNNTNSNWRFDGNGTISAGSVIYGDQAGNINFAAVPSLNNGSYFELSDADLKSKVYFQVSASGAMARAKKLKLETANFPDYVFDRDYKLPSLSSISLYINQNHHLPEMPTAKEVNADGLDIGEINKILVKKVEELTLYLIETKKDIDKLRKRLAHVEKGQKFVTNNASKKRL